MTKKKRERKKTIKKLFSKMKIKDEIDRTDIKCFI